MRWGVWDVPAAVIPLSYVGMIESAGGRPLLVPPSAEGIDETLDAIDGLIFSGGSDIDPAEYGHDAHPETNEHPPRARPRRAGAPDGCARAGYAGAGGLPRLAGAQRRAWGRSRPAPSGRGRATRSHKHTPGVFADHDVEVKVESRLGSLLGDRAPVKSHHHQGFGRVGEGLVETAWAEDGTLEAVEDPGKRFAVGVLWHPEAGEDAALFRALVDEARAYRAAKSGVVK